MQIAAIRCTPGQGAAETNTRCTHNLRLGASRARARLQAECPAPLDLATTRRPTTTQPPTTTAGADRHPRLICAPEQVFDVAGVNAALAQIDSTPEGAAQRAEIVAILRRAQPAGRAAIAEGFAGAPFDARAMPSPYTSLTAVPYTHLTLPTNRHV